MCSRKFIAVVEDKTADGIPPVRMYGPFTTRTDALMALNAVPISDRVTKKVLPVYPERRIKDEIVLSNVPQRHDAAWGVR